MDDLKDGINKAIAASEAGTLRFKLHTGDPTLLALRPEWVTAVAVALHGHDDATEDTLGPCRCECGVQICPDDGGMSHGWHYREHLAAVALSAALPLIAEAIEAAGRTEVEEFARYQSDKIDMGRLIGAEDAWKQAIHIVRGD